MATVANLQHFIVKLKCSAGEALLASMGETHARVLGGDLTIADEVRANRQEQERLAAAGAQGPLRAFGEYVEKTRPAGAAELNDFDPTTAIDNALNQAVIGFTGSTTNFKRQNHIRDSYPLPCWMDRTQLNLRSIGASKIDALLAERAVHTHDGVKGVTSEVASKLSDFAAYMNVQKFHDVPYDARARQLEADARQAKRLCT